MNLQQRRKSFAAEKADLEKKLTEEQSAHKSDNKALEEKLALERDELCSREEKVCSRESRS